MYHCGAMALGWLVDLRIPSTCVKVTSTCHIRYASSPWSDPVSYSVDPFLFSESARSHKNNSIRDSHRLTEA